MQRTRDALLARADKIVGRRALALQSKAQMMCPVDTGRLRQSITAERKDIAHWRVGTNVEYAKWVEYGTANQRPQPFLRPARDFIGTL